MSVRRRIRLMCRLSSRISAFAVLCLFPLLAHGSRGVESWETTVTPYALGSFPELRPLHAKYNFGWNGVTAASGDIRFGKNANGQLELQASGGTVGFVRNLWAFDVTHRGVSDAQTLRPLEV